MQQEQPVVSSSAQMNLYEERFKQQTCVRGTTEQKVTTDLPMPQNIHTTTSAQQQQQTRVQNLWMTGRNAAMTAEVRRPEEQDADASESSISPSSDSDSASDEAQYYGENEGLVEKQQQQQEEEAQLLEVVLPAPQTTYCVQAEEAEDD